MINCSECGKFISHAWSNLSEICDDCKPIKNNPYTYRITWSEEDKEYVGLCAEFPSLSWLADSQEVALQGIRSVVVEVVSDMD